MNDPDYYGRYAAALKSYLMAGAEASLEVGHDLGRQALRDRISTLEIIETLDDIDSSWNEHIALESPA